MNYGENTSAVEVPDFIEFTSEDRAALSKREYPIPREGWMLWEIVEEKRGFSKKGNYEITYKFCPVDEQGEIVKKVSSRLRVYPPLRNRNKEGHEAPNTTLGCWFFARALDPKFPAYPKKVKPGVYETEAGEILTGADYNAERDRINGLIADTATQWWNDKGGLVGTRLYAKNENTVDDQGRTWSELVRTSATPPDNEPLITSDFIQK